jgi:hypothetical protein
MQKNRTDSRTRREFVKEVSCTALVGALISLDAGAAAPVDIPANKELLVAPCGLFCGACPMYIATQSKDEKKVKALMQQFSGSNSNLNLADLQCDGCIGGGRVASFCRRCEMRDCAAKKPDVTRCPDCKEFPCSKITGFNNDGMLHHAEVLDNCRHIREAGIGEWTKSEVERWSCPQCRKPMSWYDGKCSECGAQRSDRLFPLKRS